MGAAAVYAAFSHTAPQTRPPEQSTVIRAPIAAPVATAAPTRSPADLLLIAKRLLLLTHTGQFRSRDLHGRALRALELIDHGAPEYPEAAQLKRGIIVAYTGKGAAAPTPDGSRIPPVMLAALEAPINLARNPANGDEQAARQAPSDGTSIEGLEDVTRQRPRLLALSAQQPQPMGGPACEENGTCYGDISAATGRPKTVVGGFSPPRWHGSLGLEVHGYYRSNGTYVRGHYRSK